MRKNTTSLEKLAITLELSPEDQKHLLQRKAFPINIPERLIKKMKKGSIKDPLFLQFVPFKEELIEHVGYKKDPVDDAAFYAAKNLLCKYKGRALIITIACAMHCRYCFRQNFSYPDGTDFTEALEAIRNDHSLEEVILSGGDPLSLSDRALEELLTELNMIPHIQRIRFHTRFLMGIPERIDDNFLSILKKQKKAIWFVIHANHPHEFDEDVWDSIRKIQLLGIPVLHQAALLKGVNDSIDTLKKLYSELANHNVIPYYLHQLDQVTGTHHFFVDKESGKCLIKELRESLSGFIVPRYVEEIPHKKSKTLIY